MYSLSPIAFQGPSFVATSLGANDPKIGDVMVYGTEHYRFVYNTGNSQISVGRACVLSAVSNYSVTVSSVTITAGNLVAGVCKNATILTGQYGWVVEKGFVSCVVPDGAAIGAILIVTEDGGWVTKATAPAALCNINAKAMSAVASGTATGICYVSIS